MTGAGLGRRAALLAIAATLASCASAATRQADPGTLAAVLAASRSGDTIQARPGNYGQVRLRNRDFSPAITLLLGAAQLTLEIDHSSGIAVQGGRFGPANAPGLGGRGASVSASRNVSFAGSTFVDSRIGLVIFRSQDVTVRRATLTGMTADGIDVISSQRVTVEESSCAGFVESERHPDCVQIWSRPGLVTRDVLIRNNRAEGRMQGFSAFNATRNGVSDGGFDRLRMIGNVVTSTTPNGVIVNDCRGCEVTGNRSRRTPAGKWKVRVRALRCTDCKVDDNRDSD